MCVFQTVNILVTYQLINSFLLIENSASKRLYFDNLVVCKLQGDWGEIKNLNHINVLQLTGLPPIESFVRCVISNSKNHLMFDRIDPSVFSTY